MSSHDPNRGSVDWADEAEGALGMNSPLPFDVASESFLSALVLTKDEQVVDWYSIGQRDFSTDWYFTPCAQGPDSQSAGAIVRLAAQESEVIFTLSTQAPEHHYWYISPEEFESLTAAAR